MSCPFPASTAPAVRRRVNPSGPVAVGTVDRVMIDPARATLYRYTPKTNSFMVTFWYPADPPAASVLPAAMWDQRTQQRGRLNFPSCPNP